MKKILLLTFTCLSSIIYAQSPTSFSLSKDGLTDFVVTDIPGKSKSELYKKTLEWIDAKYKNSKETIKSQTENENITIESTTKPLVSLNPAAKTTHLSKYQVVVNFRDGKYKFDVASLEYYVAPSQIDAGGWRKVNITDVTDYYTRMGELRSTYKYFPEIADFFNKLNEELKQFMLGETTAAKKSEW